MAISGMLDLSMPNEPHPFPPADKWQYTQHHPFKDDYESNRRSVYLMTKRLNALPYFVTFDGADRNASTPTRDSSVTSVQALFMLNDQFVHEQAEQFAERLLRDAEDDDSRLNRAFLLALGRVPTDSERSTATSFLAEMDEKLKGSGIADDQRKAGAWAGLARVLFRTNEFMYID